MVRRRGAGGGAALTLDKLGVPKDREGRERYVREMFDSISHRYDLLNRLLSFGQDVLWRKAAAALACGDGVGHVLDVATGTGDLALEVARRLGPHGSVVGVDFALGMMKVGVAKIEREGMAARVRMVGGNGLALPFVDGAFDAATTAFAARNVADLLGFFRELRRVVRPGGRVVCLELSHPSPALWRWLYELYFYHAVPRIGRLLIGRSGPYEYLPGSLTDFPDPDRLATVMAAAGLTRVQYRLKLGGIAAIHVGEVPQAADG